MFESNPPRILWPANPSPDFSTTFPYPMHVLSFSFKNNIHRFRLVVDPAFAIGVESSAGVWAVSQAYNPEEAWHSN